VDENMLKIHESLKRGKRTISRAKPPSAEVQATVRPLRATAGRAALVSKIAEDAGITKSAAIKMLDSLVDSVTKTLKKGGAVTLLGFGTFSVTKRAARNGRNPQTGSVIKIKAKKVARFKPSPSLNEKMKR
jgi:DNA-binding protein HU-beta